MHDGWMGDGGVWEWGEWTDRWTEPVRCQEVIEVTVYAKSPHVGLCRTFFSSAGPSNKRRGPPSPSSWTCWRNCRSETAACLTPGISGSLQSRCSSASLPAALVPRPLSPLCFPLTSPATPLLRMHLLPPPATMLFYRISVQGSLHWGFGARVCRAGPWPPVAIMATSLADSS